MGNEPPLRSGSWVYGRSRPPSTVQSRHSPRRRRRDGSSHQALVPAIHGFKEDTLTSSFLSPSLPRSLPPTKALQHTWRTAASSVTSWDAQSDGPVHDTLPQTHAGPPALPGYLTPLSPLSLPLTEAYGIANA